MTLVSRQLQQQKALARNLAETKLEIKTRIASASVSTTVIDALAKHLVSLQSALVIAKFTPQKAKDQSDKTAAEIRRIKNETLSGMSLLH